MPAYIQLTGVASLKARESRQVCCQIRIVVEVERLRAREKGKRVLFPVFS